MKIKIAVMLALAGLAGTVALASTQSTEPQVDEAAVRAVIDARLHELLNERIARELAASTTRR